MCKDSLLSLKTKLIVFSVEEMCGTIRTSDVQMCNIVTELETLSREVWVLCSMEKSLFIFEQESPSCQPIFHIPVCKMSVYKMYNIKTACLRL